jgi:OOP family OmpA-OmpF porin
MAAWLKFLIGLAAALLGGWLVHGPLGQGESFVDRLQSRADAVLRDAAVPGVEVRFPRAPLSRQAILSGPANAFQREGQGLFPGLNDRMSAIRGVSGLRWDDAGSAARGRSIPLFAEIELMAFLAYLVGIGLARLFFRPRREHFLD